MRPLKPSQTFSRNLARTNMAEGDFCPVGAGRRLDEVFYLMKMPIKHNGHYAHCFWQAIGPFSDLNGDLVIASRVSPQEPFRLNSVEPQWR